MGGAAVIRRANELLASGRLVECLDVVSRAVRDGEKTTEVFLTGARAMVAMGRLEEALSTLDRCLGGARLAEEQALRREILRALIEYYEEIGLAPALLLAYRRYLDVERADARAWVNMGLACLALPEPSPQDAEVCFIEATKVDPDQALAWYNMGVLYFECGKPGDALKSLQRAVEADPNQADAWYCKGMCHLEFSKRVWLGKVTHKPQALRCFRRALALDPEHEAAADELRRNS